MNYAVIDIGSNTVKCEFFSYENGNLNAIDFISEQLGIIARIKNGELLADDIMLLCNTINRYKAKAKEYKAKLFCFATESLRQINNLEPIKQNVHDICGVEIDMISGDDEALLSFEGFMAEDHNIKNGIMVDMGGGSTEILLFDNSRVEKLNSFKFGCLALKRDFVKGRFPSQDEKEKISKYVSEYLAKFPWIADSKRLCLIGGTGSAIGKLAIELGYTTVPEFSKEKFNELFDFLAEPSEKETELLEKYIPARVETILPGMTAYRTIIDTVNAESVYVSKGGIRNGYIYKKIKEEAK